MAMEYIRYWQELLKSRPKIPCRQHYKWYLISNFRLKVLELAYSVFFGLLFFFWNEMNFYLDEFQKINIGFKYKQIDLQMLQNI